MYMRTNRDLSFLEEEEDGSKSLFEGRDGSVEDVLVSLLFEGGESFVKFGRGEESGDYKGQMRFL